MENFMESIRTSIQNRIKNPFLGTLTFVYIFKNWEFFYCLFTLPLQESIDQRIEKITPLFVKAIGWDSIGIVLGITVLIFLSSYVMISFSRLVIMFFSKRVYPRLEKATDDKAVVSRSEYDSLTTRFVALEEKLEAEHSLVTRLRDERNQLQEKLLDVGSKKTPLVTEEKPKREVTKKSTSLPNPVFEKLFKSIIEHEWATEFDSAITELRNSRRMDDSELISELVRFGMISKRGGLINSETKVGTVFDFTPLGNDFVQYYVLNR